MEGKETTLLGEKMKQAQEAAMAKRWGEFKRVMMEEKENLVLERMEWNGNTPIHVVARYNKAQLLEELMEALGDDEQRWRALRKRNDEGNTVLHELVFCDELNGVVQVANVVLDLDEKLRARSWSSMEENVPLWDVGNDDGETPLFMAAKHGKLSLLKHLANHVATRNMGDIISHHFRRSDGLPALHASIIHNHFDVAIWLVNLDRELAMEKGNDNKRLTSLQVLCNMPQVFRGYAYPRLGRVTRILYRLLPKDGFEVEDCKKDESNHPNKSVFQKINGRFWKELSKGIKGIERIWKHKRKHILAESLANTLIQHDLSSWQISNGRKRKTLMTLPQLPPSVPRTRRIIERKRQEKRKDAKKSPRDRTPLLIAAKTGIVEIVQGILRKNPEAIYHITEDGLNILNMAIKYRQKEIIGIIKEKNAIESLARQITDKGRTVLHEAARTDYYKAKPLPGVAFQLQDELRWFEEVKGMVPKHYIMRGDEMEQTAEDLLEIEHGEMLKKSQTWIKETAQSCSTVAVLVATVVFAAAFTVPGGMREGIPEFHNHPLFHLFTIMDIAALVASVASVVIFLSILTSPCELWDFRKSLPRKLTLGFALLFISLMTTMLAFSATIWLTVRLKWKDWTSSLIYSAAFFPVLVFAMVQFPFFVIVNNTIKRFWKLLR